jgi:hypothetical protein
MLLAAYPAGAGIADTQGLIPLFLCCMREDATADICKALCKAFPNGPTTKNKTNSYPLHFAAKRKVPNLDILRILIRRNPAAAGAVNDFGLLPMHCITALSDNVQAVELIHSADESAVKVREIIFLLQFDMMRSAPMVVLISSASMRCAAVCHHPYYNNCCYFEVRSCLRSFADLL